MLLVAFKERTALQVTTRLSFALDSACTAPPNPTQADPVEQAMTFANQAAQDGADVQALNILESTLHQAEERQQLARVLMAQRNQPQALQALARASACPANSSDTQRAIATLLRRSLAARR